MNFFTRSMVCALVSSLMTSKLKSGGGSADFGRVISLIDLGTVLLIVLSSPAALLLSAAMLD